MDQLPSEVLVSIFRHLPQSSLLSIAAVCPLFRGIVENFDLIDHLYVNEKNDESSIPYRKYTKATLRIFKPDVHQKIFAEKGSLLESLELSRCSLDLIDVFNILRATPNLKKLTFYYVRLNDDTINGSVELPSLSDITLIFSESDPLIFRALQKSTMQSIQLQFYGDVPYSNFSEFAKLMKEQQSLTSFTVSGIYESNLFLIPMGKPKYQLKTFSIDNCDLEEWENLDEYLTQHVGSLEKLVVRNIPWDPSTILNQCTNLKAFQSQRVEINSLQVIASVQELSLEPAFGILDKFPGVKKLNVSLTTPENFQVITQTMKGLEEVEIRFGRLAGLEVPSLKKLKLLSIDMPINGEFFVIHNQIEELNLHHIFTIDDELLEAITFNLVNLKELRILGDNHLTLRAFSIIRNNCRSLKVFEMTKWDQKFKKSDWNCLNQIQGLQVFTEKFD